MRGAIIAIFLLTFTLSVPVASAKSADDRLNELEKRVTSIQQTYLTNNADIARSLASVESIRQDFAALKGTVEANGYLIETQRQELQRLIRDLEQRIQAIEDRLEIFATQINAAIGKVAPNIAEEGKLYQSSLDKANRGEYLNAAADFQNFIKKYPKSQFVPSAQYWIGECFYSMKDYKRAIKEYQVFIETFPKNEKVASALLKQGNSFYELGLTDESKPFFEKIMKDYPNSPEASQAGSKIQKINQKKSEGPSISMPRTPGTNLPSYPTETIEQQKSKYNQQVPATSGQGTKQPQPSAPAKTDTKERRYIEF